MADRTIENPDLSPATGLIAVSGLVILLVYTVKATQSVEGSPEKKNQILALRSSGPHVLKLWLGVNFLYEVALVFLLFQDLSHARSMIGGVTLPEKGYADDCSLNFKTLWNALDAFCAAHIVGWLGKALVLRDYWFCWILSITFELAEYSLQHQLPNFNECWWDHWVLDVLVCNWIGTYVGMKTCEYFQLKPYEWRGPRVHSLTLYDFTTFKWSAPTSFTNYVTVLLLLVGFVAAEINPFYLKSLLLMRPDHPIVVIRIVLILLCAVPAASGLFHSISDPRGVTPMGKHLWLLLATVLTEVVLILKWSQGQFAEVFPASVKWGVGSVLSLLVIYPIYRFGIPRAWILMQ
ncbi:phosphatidylserine synthase 2 [Mycena olivaceomarginata]|nr:phosphatidylserine synthase 2 [Mycena olivaceomarginata]